MWVSQTYLGEVEPDAQIFVYYLYEDYNSKQKAFTQRVQRELEKLGEVYGNSVSLLFPNTRSAARIGEEVRSFQDFWWSLGKKLPSLLISSKPLSKFDFKDGEYYVLDFVSLDPKGAAQAVHRLRQLINEQLAYQFAHRPEMEQPSLFGELFAALELKAGFGPVKIDLKKVGDALAKRRRRIMPKNSLQPPAMPLQFTGPLLASVPLSLLETHRKSFPSTTIPEMLPELCSAPMQGANEVGVAIEMQSTLLPAATSSLVSDSARE